MNKRKAKGSKLLKKQNKNSIVRMRIGAWIAMLKCPREAMEEGQSAIACFFEGIVSKSRVSVMLEVVRAIYERGGIIAPVI
jgi:hypothetical protein